MVIITDQTVAGKSDSTPSLVNTKRCLACGTDRIKAGRRYCSTQCRQQMNWVLSLSKGLLRVFNARYAAFFFTNDQVVLDVLPFWSKNISRFILVRTEGNKPADDLKSLILQWGKRWHQLVNNNNSKSYASFSLIEKALEKDIDPDSIMPDKKASARLSEGEKSCLKILRLERKDLSPGNHVMQIKSAYRKMAKVYHPDMGGDEDKFKQLNDAHTQMLQWAEHPNFSFRKALHGCWSYDGDTNRWSPPL